MNTTDIIGPKGRAIKDCEILAENVVKHVTKKGKENFYLREKTSGLWKFSHEKRFEGLKKRFGSVEAISERYLTPVEAEIIRSQAGHELEYLLDKQPGVTRTRKSKPVKKAGPPRDAKGRFIKKEERVTA